MSSAIERRVAQLEHDHRMDREQIINLTALVMELVAIVDPDTHQQALDDLALENGLEPGGTWTLRPHGSETN